MFTITINGNTPEELATAVRNLASSLTGANTILTNPVEAPAPAPMTGYQQPPAPAPAYPQQPVQYPQQPAQPAAYPQQPVQYPTQAPAPTPAPAVPVATTTYTMDQLAVAATQLMDANPQTRTTVVSLLGQFGVQALTALPKEQYGAFATRLRELGAKI